MISRETKMADVIHMNYMLLFVLDRFSIKLGFGDQTVEEVCTHNKLDTDFVVEIINSFLDVDYIPNYKGDKFPMLLAIQYLQNSHRYYLDIKLPEIENLIQTLIANCQLNKKNMVILNSFFEEYNQELTTHINREEDSVFYYIKKIEAAFNTQQVSPALYSEMQQYSILDYASEHDNVEEKLYDLKNIIIKYLPPVNNQYLLQRILVELFNLEKDLNDHALLEDRLIVPLVAEKESALKALYLSKICADEK